MDYILVDLHVVAYSQSLLLVTAVLQPMLSGQHQTHSYIARSPLGGVLV